MGTRAWPIPSSAGRLPIAAAVVAGLLASSCSPALSPSPGASAPVTGGTLKVVVVANGTEALEGAPYYDPAVYWSFSPLNRCCLGRTLLSYNGRPPEEGGAELHPDLAAGLPEVSRDGLTWTFRLKPDIRYAPPLEDRVIEARDFVTALEYAVRHGDPFYVDDIVGVGGYRDGSVDTIAGIEAPDPTTLVIHLSLPASDLGNRMATSAAAPIPAEALAGRETGYAGFVVSSGPYMYEGAEALDLADPDAEPIWAGRDSEPVVLVRNPSWDPATDPLRGAYVDRIEVILANDPDAAAALVEAGTVDVMGEPAPAGVVERYLGEPHLRDRAFTQSAGRVQYLPMNLALPPFDDVHVRRAVNLVLDRDAAAEELRTTRGQLFVVANHAFPDLLLSNLLLRYAPYGTSGDRGDLRAAQDEMRASAYDSDGDGVCDAAECADVPVGVVPGSESLFELVASDLAEIGIAIVPTSRDFLDPSQRVGGLVGLGWAVDLPNASNFVPLLRSSGFPGQVGNSSLLGASSADLEAWGYPVTQVPSIDPRVDACSAAVGSDAFECWAAIDQLVMERVVAWAPLGFAVNGWITSDRVTAFSADANSVFPALDQLQLRPDD